MAALGVRASADWGELPSGDPPKLPAEMSLLLLPCHPPHSASPPTSWVPASACSSFLSLSLSSHPLSSQSLLRCPGGDHDGGWALWPDTGRIVTRCFRVGAGAEQVFRKLC